MPVARSPVPKAPRRPQPPDLLPRLLAVSFTVVVLSLVAVYAVRSPSPNTFAAQPEAGLIAGVDRDEEPDWLQIQTSALEQRALRAPLATREPGEDEYLMGVAEEGVDFDMLSTTRACLEAEDRAKPCWEMAQSDEVTIAVRFLPEGLPIEAEVKEREIVGEQAAACFEVAFWGATVPTFIGPEQTVQHNMSRPESIGAEEAIASR